jgi:hypothetical protein
MPRQKFLDDLYQSLTADDRPTESAIFPLDVTVSEMEEDIEDIDP